jgi:hypothetical protein
MNELYKITLSQQDGKWRAVILRTRDEHHIAVEDVSLFICMDLARQIIDKSEAE